MPSEFVRVRYFYGQRLGVAELADEAAYHAGKHAFNNLRLHGVGVLCGLNAERFALRDGEKTTVLRVRRGAALDACGREVVVGADQCIDVGAWYAKNAGRQTVKDAVQNGRLELVVGVRYRESQSDPSPAPRDPCSCDESGCEFARVHEGFELALFTRAERANWKTSERPFPSAADVTKALRGAPEADVRAALQRALNEALASDCPRPADELWLEVAALGVVMGADEYPRDLEAPTLADRRSLLSTTALQAALAELGALAIDSGNLGTGPRVVGLQFVADAAGTDGVLSLRVELAGAPLATGTLYAAVKQKGLGVWLLDNGEWRELEIAKVAYDDTTQRIEIRLTKAPTAGVHRLVIEASLATPIVDASGRALQPRQFARTFNLVSVATGALALGSTVL